MATALEIVFAAGLGVVALSFVGVALGRLPERALVGLTALLGAAGVLAGVALGLNFAEDYAETEPLLLATGGILAAAMAEGGLVALRRGLVSTRDIERLSDAATERLRAVIDGHATERAADLDRTLARERADARHLLGEQERRLAEERRDLVARQAERARAELTDSVASVQERLERRLAAWAADLDRGQYELERQLGELAQRQREALAAQDARLAVDAEALAAAAEEQRAALARLRTDLERLATQVLEEGRAEIEAHAAERRRALHEVSERLRGRERSMREQVEHEEVEARARLATGIEELKKRQLEQLERGFTRTVTSLLEDAERRFDAQIKESREKSAERLGRELEKAMQEFARRAEKEVSNRIAEVAKETADRLEVRLDDLAKAAELQQQASAERIRLISERLHRELSEAEERISAFEAQIESEMTAKLAELERALRAGEGDGA